MAFENDDQTKPSGDLLGCDGSPNTSQSQRLALLGLVAFAMVTCFWGLHDGPAMGDHECINALAARQTLQSGDWLIPQLGEIPRIRKPPLGIWLIAASSYLFNGADASAPVTDYSARFPSALAAWGTIMLIYWLGRQMYGFRAGITSAFIAASSVGIILFAHNAQVDMVLTFFTTLTFACFWRGAIHTHSSRLAMAAAYVSFAAAMMAKAPLPLVTVGLALGVYWFISVPLSQLFSRDPHDPTTKRDSLLAAISGQVRRLKSLWIIPGLILFVLLAGAWPAYVFFHMKNALVLWDFEYFDRFTGEMTSHNQPLLYYIPLLFGLVAPFMLSLPEAIAAPFLRRYNEHRKGLIFVLTWALVGTCFLSTSALKRSHYLLSLLPAYCLLLGPVIDHLFFGLTDVSKRTIQITCRLLPALIALAAIVGGIFLSKHYPALIRSYVVASALTVIIWATASISYARNRRVDSFAKLLLGVLVLLLTAWPGIRSGVHMNPEADALATALKANNIRPDDQIFWVGGRPDASLEFYSDYRVRRIINEIEMTSIRTSRTNFSDKMYDEYERRIASLLSDPRPVYLIMADEHLDMIRSSTSLNPRILFRLDGFHDADEDERIVVTQ